MTRQVLSLLLPIGILVGSTSTSAWGKSAGPPDGVAGNPPEFLDCSLCHFTYPVNSGPGAVEVLGVPDAFEPGAVYDLIVRVETEGQMRWGFELTVLDDTDPSLQGGQLEVLEPDRTQLSEDADGEVDYLKHTLISLDPLGVEIGGGIGRRDPSHRTTKESPMPTNIDFAKLDLMDALDLAVLIEVEAFQRYKMFAAQLGHRAPGDAASVFASMAKNEAKHGEDLAERRKALFGDAPVRVSRDDIFDVEAPDQGAPRATMSTLQAFQVALASEQKAFDFYDRALEYVTNPEIKALFTELRDEETEHVELVEKAIAALPAGSDVEWEDDDDELPAL